MNNDLVSVKALPEFRLEVELVDGRRGVMDLKPHLGIPALSRLRDPAYFERVRVFHGAPTWPQGEDIAPAAIAAELHATQAA